MSETTKQADFFKVLVIVLLVGILVFSIVSIFLYTPEEDTTRSPITLFVFISAILGSAVNESTRRRGHLQGETNFEKIFLLSWKLLVAIVFSLFLYLAFMSGILSGHLFPQFQNVQDTAYQDMMTFMANCKPATNEDVSKLFVWAFIAGYIERFVPNLAQPVQNKPRRTSTKA